jgi:hypothetical protein
MSSSPQDPRYFKKWRYDAARGVTRLVDAGPTVTRINDLVSQGASIRAIADAAGLSATAICKVRQGHQPKVSRVTANRVAGLTLASIISRPHGPGFVPKIGAVRRIQGLLAIGWTHAHINAAGELASHRSENTLGQAGDWINRDTHDAICRVYDQLSMTSGPSARTRGRAAKLGYPPPLAWDDDEIDDPAAVPQHQVQDVAGSGVDQAAIERRIGGEDVPLTRAERWVAVRRLHAEGMTDPDIARRLRIWDRQVFRDRESLGLPANWGAA